MKHNYLKTLAFMALLTTGCSKNPLSESPSPQSKATQNSLGGGGQVPLDIVQMATGEGETSYFRVSTLEPSGGNKLYTWKSTAANNGQLVPQGYPGCPTYVPSPGAIWVATRADAAEVCLIVTPSNDIYFQDGPSSSWVMLNTNGRKFLKIATRDFQIQSNGSSINAYGLLYGIGTDHLVYRFDVTSLTWAVQGSLYASDITIDPEGHPWVISYNARTRVTAGNIYRTTAYRPFSGWVQYSTPTLASSISTSYSGTVTGILYTSPLYVTSSSDPAGVLYWEPATTSPTQNAFQVVDPNQVAPYSYVYGGDYDDQLWVTASNYSKDVFRYRFDGL